MSWDIYERLPDEELLRIWREGGLQAAAAKALLSEIEKRGLQHHETIEFGYQSEPSSHLRRKKLWLAILLTVVFGPLGLFYVSLEWGLLLTISGIAGKVFLRNLGLEYKDIFAVILWASSIGLAFVTAKGHNQGFNNA